MADNLKLPDIEHQTFIDAAPSSVYDTLTTGKGWDAWFTEGTTVDPKPGGTIRLRWRDFGVGRGTVEDGGAVLEAEQNRKFSFQWSPAGTPTTIIFTLEPLGSGTLVKLLETGYGSTATELEALIDCAVGWGEALTLLKFYLEYGVTYGVVPAGENSA